MALALATLTSASPPSTSRAVTMLAPLLWIAYRAGISITIEPQVAHFGERGLGHVQLRYRSEVHAPIKIPRVEDAVGADDFGQWIGAAAFLAVALWELMRPEDETDAGKSLRKTVRQLSEAAPKEKRA